MHLMHITDQSYTRDNFCQNNVIRRSASHRRWNSRLEHRRLAGWLCPELPPFCTNLPNWQNGKYQTFWDHLPFYRANFLQNKFNKKTFIFYISTFSVRSYFTFRPFLCARRTSALKWQISIPQNILKLNVRNLFNTYYYIIYKLCNYICRGQAPLSLWRNNVLIAPLDEV